MSEKEKQTTAKKAVAKQTGPIVYCGPTVKNTVKQFTVYNNEEALPDAVTAFLNKVPAAKSLMVQVDRFAETRAALENPKSSVGILFAAVKAALN